MARIIIPANRGGDRTAKSQPTQCFPSGSEEGMQGHGYCGHAGKIEVE